jgi:KDO2-lipid IV(A) lauroyltransferase
VAERIAAPAAAPRRIPVAWEKLRPRLRRGWRYWIRDPLLAALNFPMHHAFRLLPIDWVSGVGGYVGALNGKYRFHTVRERVQRAYLRLAPGVPTAADAERAAVSLFDNLGRMIAEYSAIDRLWRGGRIAVAGGEHLIAARTGGRPVIVMGLHLANFEAIGPTILGLLPGTKAAGFYLPPPSRFDHKLLVAARRRYGAIMYPPGPAGSRMAHRLLSEERGVLLVYADEERQRHVNAPLFGRPIPPRSNLLAIVRYAWASGAQVVPAYAERLAGARFRVTYLPPVALRPEGEDRAAALSENVHRLDRVITPIVLAHLDQWYMLVEFRA